MRHLIEFFILIVILGLVLLGCGDDPTRSSYVIVDDATVVQEVDRAEVALRTLYRQYCADGEETRQGSLEGHWERARIIEPTLAPLSC